MRDERVEIVAFKLRARGHRTDAVEVPWRGLGDARPVARSSRGVCFDAAIGPLPTAVVGRMDLEDAPRPGPLIIEEYDSTVVVPPGWTARRNTIGFIVLERSS